jgi:hypothetical protein
MRKIIVTAALAVLSLGGLARADTYYVSSLSNTPGSIGYDPDKPPPTVTPTGFYATGTTGQYNSVRFAPDAIGMTGLKLGDITSIAYDHQQAGGGLDWQMKVYTVSSASSGSGWYGYRLNYDLSTGQLDGSWSNFSDTNANGERIKPFNSTDVYNASNPSGFASLLANIMNEQVLFFDISAGANSGGYPYNTFLNNITINTATASSTVSVVPLPASVWGGLALMGVVIVRRKFRVRTA